MKEDMVNHPKHYNAGKFEVIDVIDDWKLNFARGCVVKYVARAQHKGTELEDLKKAAWYLNYEIEGLEPLMIAAPINGPIHTKPPSELCALTSKLMSMTSTHRLEDALRDLELAMSFVLKHEERNPTHLLSPEGVACGASSPQAMTSKFEEVTCKDCRVAFMKVGTK